MESGAKRTDHGFQFGSALVECLASDEKKGWVMVGVKTPKGRIDVYATKTGKLRAFLDGVEMVKE